MWTTKLKIAIVEKNIDAIDTLLDNLPQLEDKKEIEEALYLLHEAENIVTNLKNSTQDTMIQMKKNLIFLHSTEPQKKFKLDIMS